jgi:hypothetical protein
MTKPQQEGMRLLERIQVKGRDYDRDGVLTPKEELFQVPGLFKLKDVEDRIPIDGKRLKYWYSSDGPFRKCFIKVPMGDTRSLVYVDLMMLSEEFQSQWENSKRP